MSFPALIKKIRSPLITFVTVCVVLGTAATIIAYGRGYRFDLGTTNVRPTGLMSATSQPVGAQVFIDGKLRAATDISFNIDPGWYTVAIAKEGYQTWEKRLRVQGEVVTRADAMLLPANPSLTAITGNGVVSPVLSPDGSKLAFVVPTPTATSAGTLTDRAGIWVLDLTDKPLGLNRDSRQIATNTDINVNLVTLAWSADSKQVLARLKPKAGIPSFFLLEADRLNDPPISAGSVATLTNTWLELLRTKEEDKLATLAPEFIAEATTSMKIIAFSPDETKILYEATAAATLPEHIIPALIGTNPTEETRTLTKDTLYVYDIKEDRNYSLGASSNLGVLPAPKPLTATQKTSDALFTEYAATTGPKSLQWLATSRHLVYAGNEKIDVMEYDGGNRKTVYAGPFWDTFVVPWTNGTKLVILTNLNSAASLENNLYAVNLR
jgi:hypothetical protein